LPILSFGDIVVARPTATEPGRHPDDCEGLRGLQIGTIVTANNDSLFALQRVSSDPSDGALATTNHGIAGVPANVCFVGSQTQR